jgi:hypothetical protein
VFEPLPCRSARKPVRKDCNADVSAVGVTAPGLVAEEGDAPFGLVEAAAGVVAVVAPAVVPFRSSTSFVNAEFSEESVPADSPELFDVLLSN